MHPSLNRALAACAGLSLALLALPASAAITDLVGRWRNVDPATRGVSQMTVRQDNGQLIVHVWGKCHPNDCDWGEASAQVFTPNAGVPMDAGADAAVVEFDKGSIQTMLLLQTGGDGNLIFKTFTIFTNGDRSNYHDSGHLGRW